MTAQPTASRNRDVALQLAIIAAAASIILTAAAFWLSYEHLHDVARTHGLADAARAWAWPATVDLFIMIGEVLMLRAGLRGRGTDWWAIGLTATGSAGSIALNVAGVGTDASPMNYVVAAVPPVAALLAFGALMRQIHGALAKRTAATATPVETATQAAPEAPQQAPTERSESDTDTAPVAAPERHETPAQSAPRAPKPSAPKRHQSGAKTTPKRSKPSDRDAAKTAIEALYGTLGRRPLETEMVDELKRIKNKYTSPAFAKKIRTEIEKDDPALAALGTDNVRPLTG